MQGSHRPCYAVFVSRGAPDRTQWHIFAAGESVTMPYDRKPSDSTWYRRSFLQNDNKKATEENLYRFVAAPVRLERTTP